MIRLFLNIVFTISLIVFFQACAQKKAETKIGKSFNSQKLIIALASNLSPKISSIVKKKEDKIVIVPDFVNIDSYTRGSRLSFLLSQTLKSILTSRFKLKIQEINMRQNFSVGRSGFKVLSRDKYALKDNISDDITYAFVGSYSITDTKLILFLNLTEIKTGQIIATSIIKMDVSESILKLEYPNYQKNPRPVIYQPLTL